MTGQLVRIDLKNQTALIVNAGHPHPLRLRDGQVTSIELEPDLPFGLGHQYRAQPLPLAAGDRLVFLTDGLLERNAASLDVEALVLEEAGLHPREAVQHLIKAVLDGTGGGQLKDDATVMCLDWHGGPPRQRTTNSGGNR